ncbi:MAG: polysaccharide deacetylase family protein, partial [Clostridia bacterium]|nr:polysaccharide deacetylase family protein [Clostridia bacterium]
MNKSHFYMLLSNGLIAIMLLSLSVLTFVDPIKSVVMENVYKVYYNGDTTKANVSLMFNVYWGNEYLDGILKVLDENEIHTTFFVGGIWVEKYSEEFAKIVNAGHEIGNHGYFHKSHDVLNYQQNQDEIMSTHKLVKNLCGINMSLFAPPSGAYNDT